MAPPPSRTASFSRTRRPGVVLRVQTILALWPAIASTSERVAVATPDSRQSRLSAVRSAASTARARPLMRRHRLAALDPAAVGAERSIARPGRAARTPATPASSPATTPGLRAAITALDPRLGGDDRIGGDVAGAAEILQQRGADDRLDEQP